MHNRTFHDDDRPKTYTMPQGFRMQIPILGRQTLERNYGVKTARKP